MFSMTWIDIKKNRRRIEKLKKTIIMSSAMSAAKISQPVCIGDEVSAIMYYNPKDCSDAAQTDCGDRVKLCKIGRS